MKKYFLLISLFIVIGFCPFVSAKVTTNGVSVSDDELDDKNAIGLYCSYYNGDYVRIMRNSATSEGSVMPNNLPFSQTSNSTLETFKFMNSDGTIDCPLYIYGEASETGGPLKKIVGFTNSEVGHNSDYVYAQLNTSESECKGMCSGNWWTCVYSGRQGRLITQYDSLSGYTIYFPDGAKTEPDPWEISATCDDLYYNRETHKIIYSTSSNSDNNNQYLCDNRDVIDYYCSGECNFPDNAKLDCYDIDTGTHPDTSQGETRNPMYEDGDLSEICSDEKVQNTLKFLGRLLIVAKIIVPLLLIIFGTIDFGKAIAASKEDSLGKAGKMLIVRIIIGIVIFLVPTIVNFVFELVGHGNTSYNECRICIFEPKLCGKGR